MLSKVLKVGAKIVNPEAAAALLKTACKSGKGSINKGVSAASALPGKALDTAAKVGDEFVRPTVTSVINMAAHPRTGSIIRTAGAASTVYAPLRVPVATAEVLHQTAKRLQSTDTLADGAQVIVDAAKILKK